MMAFQDIKGETNIKALITSMTLAILFVIALTLARWYKGKGFATEDYLCWFAPTCFITMCSLYLTVLDPLCTSQAVVAGTLPAPGDRLAKLWQGLAWNCCLHCFDVSGLQNTSALELGWRDEGLFHSRYVEPLASCVTLTK